MTGLRRARALRRQGGWAGIVMLLASLVVVGFLVRSALKSMGLSDGPSSAIVTGKVQPRALGSPLAPADTTAPLDRARTMQAEVLRHGATAEEKLKQSDR